MEFSQVGQLTINDSQNTLAFALSLRNILIASASFIEGISIHDSYVRGITLEGTSFLSIMDSVLINTIGSGISLSLGTEISNVLSNNLVMGTR